jgi:hypothetical protein
MNQIVKGMTQVELPPRRVVLRGALALGCGLLAPAALFGCDKQEADSTGAAPEAAPPNADSAPPSADSAMQAPDAPEASAESVAPAAAKVPQASVQYQAEPKGDQQCSGCIHFIAESNTCKLVEGQISPNGWCTLWAKEA